MTSFEHHISLFLCHVIESYKLFRSSSRPLFLDMDFFRNNLIHRKQSHSKITTKHKKSKDPPNHEKPLQATTLSNVPQTDSIQNPSIPVGNAKARPRPPYIRSITEIEDRKRRGLFGMFGVNRRRARSYKQADVSKHGTKTTQPAS